MVGCKKKLHGFLFLEENVVGWMRESVFFLGGRMLEGMNAYGCLKVKPMWCLVMSKSAGNDQIEQMRWCFQNHRKRNS